MPKSKQPPPKPEGEPGLYPRWSKRENRWVWYIVVTVDGVQKTATFKGSKSDAKDVRDEMRVSMRRGTMGKAPARKTLGSLILDDWLPLRLLSLKPRSRKEYGYTAARIAADIGAIRLAKLTAQDVDRWTLDLAASGLNGTSCAKHFTMLKMALRYAVQRELVYRNVCDQVKTPKRAEHKAPALSIDAIGKLLEEAEAVGYGLFVYLAVAEGMRWGELEALEWRHLDVAEATITISAAKTRAGERTIALGPDAVSWLQRFRLEQMARYREMNSAPPHQVFLRRDGRQITASWFWLNVWVGVRQRAGLSGLHFHDLRHVHATLLGKVKAHPSVMADRLGHTDPAFSIRVYTDADSGRQAEAAAAVEGLLRPVLSKSLEIRGREGE